MNKYKQRTSHSNVQKELIKDNSNVKKSQNASENKNKNLYKHSNRLRMNKDDHTVFFDDTNKVHNTPNKQTNDNTEDGSKVTNDLKNENKDPDEIAKEIIDLVYECKQENNTVMVSSITPRQDHLRNKAQDVN